MPRLNLRIYVDPGAADVFMNLKQNDGGFYRLAAIVDTGAAITLLPQDLMETIDFQLVSEGSITIDQAGIAQQEFRAIEANVRLFLDDSLGNQTGEFDAHVWFADTGVVLLGFADLLDRAVLHIDMPQRAGWIELNA